MTESQFLERQRQKLREPFPLPGPKTLGSSQFEERTCPKCNKPALFLCYRCHYCPSCCNCFKLMPEKKQKDIGDSILNWLQRYDKEKKVYRNGK